MSLLNIQREQEVARPLAGSGFVPSPVFSGPVPRPLVNVGLLVFQVWNPIPVSPGWSSAHRGG